MPQSALTPKQKKAISALADGASYTEAAAAAGVGVRTLWNWRQNHDFATEIEDRITILREETISKILALASESLDILSAIQRNSSRDSVRVQAATSILRQTGQILSGDDLWRAARVLRQNGYEIVASDDFAEVVALKQQAAMRDTLSRYDEPTKLPWDDDSSVPAAD